MRIKLYQNNVCIGEARSFTYTQESHNSGYDENGRVRFIAPVQISAVLDNIVFFEDFQGTWTEIYNVVIEEIECGNAEFKDCYIKSFSGIQKLVNGLMTVGRIEFLVRSVILPGQSKAMGMDSPKTVAWLERWAR